MLERNVREDYLAEAAFISEYVGNKLMMKSKHIDRRLHRHVEKQLVCSHLSIMRATCDVSNIIHLQHNSRRDDF